MPLNGIYVLFEAGEEGHEGDRIVRVGTHTGQDQLRSRLKQHFVQENKDRSIFRKNIGRALLNRAADRFLAEWEIDRTSRAARAQLRPQSDVMKQRSVETDVTAYIRRTFHFAIFRADDKSDRLRLEFKIISTVAACDECGPSALWLGLKSPKKKICISGLWLVNQLRGEPLTPFDLQDLAERLS